MNVIAIIPARGGSKGIPKKNIRLLDGKPLIAYAIKNALECEDITDVFVSTDSIEIADVADRYGAKVIMRDKKLADDYTTLDPVIFDALLKAESIEEKTYDYVITMQPTSPLLKGESLAMALKKAVKEQADAVISVINKPHLSWRDEGGKVVPNYEKRLNRQLLPANYVETGAFVITNRKMITKDTRMAGKVSVFCVSDEEGIDIDDRNDWTLTETLLNKKRIIFRVDGYALLGMGHIYNCVTLAYSMMEHDILFVINKDSKEGIKILNDTNLKYTIIDKEEEIYPIIDAFKPDIWVHDRLNTEEETIKLLKDRVERVITIEDLGKGTKHADAVINALYTDEDIKGDNIYNGWKYVCLRDEFQIEKINDFSDTVKNVMIMFGGTDPCNFNRILYDIILRISDKFPDVKFNFVVGVGYDIEGNNLKSVEKKRVFIYPNVQRVTKYMREADIAISSQGRAIFEFASMGVPTIILSQNQREKMHSFANMENGFINLGTIDEIDEQLIENTLAWLINTKAVRKNMYDLMSRYNLRGGLKRVKDIIIGN